MSIREKRTLGEVREAHHETTAMTLCRLSAASACFVGLSAIACATRLNLEHAANSDPTSPIGSALTVFGLLTAACAIAAPRAWDQGRKLLTAMIILATISGELFGLTACIERMASLRAENERLSASKNISRQLAKDTLNNARQELTEASRKATEATRGGCGRECLALRDVEASGRQRVIEAEKAMTAIGAEHVIGSPLAKLLNLDTAILEIGLSVLFGLALTLGGAGLLAFGAYSPVRIAAHNVHEQIKEAGTLETRTPDQIPDRKPSASPLDAPMITGQRGQPDLAGQIVELARASNGRLDKSVRGLATLIGKPKSTVHTTLTGLVAAGVLSKAGDGAGYVLAGLR